MATPAPTQPIPLSGSLDGSGWVNNLSLAQIPDNGWSTALNVRFQNGRIKSAPAWTKFATQQIPDRIQHGDTYVQSGLTETLILISKKKTYAYDSGSGLFNSIQDVDFTGADSDLFSSATGFGLFLSTNYVDRLRKWTGSGNITNLGGMTDCEPGGITVKARIVKVFNDFVVVLHTEENGSRCPWRVRWCKKGFPEIWKNDAFGAGQAGYTDLDDTNDALVGALEIGNSLAIYKENNIYLMSYVGPPVVHNFRRVVAGQGLLAQRGVVSVYGTHIFVGQDNFYAFNNVTAYPIGDDKIKDAFFADLAPSYRERVQAFILPQYDEVVFSYPSNAASVAGSMDKAVVFNYKTRVWSLREIPATAWFYHKQQSDYTWDTLPDTTWDGAAGLWDDSQLLANAKLHLFGDESGYIQNYGTAFSKDGVAYTKKAITGLKDFGLPGIKKRLIRLQLHPVMGASSVNLKLRVGHCANDGDPIQWSPYYDISLATGGRPWKDLNISDYYFIYEFQTDGIDDPWDLVKYVSWINVLGQE